MDSGYESIFRSIPGNKNIVPLWLNTYIYITDAWFHRVFHSTVFLPNFMDCPWMSQQNDATPKQKVKRKKQINIPLHQTYHPMFIDCTISNWQTVCSICLPCCHLWRNVYQLCVEYWSVSKLYSFFNQLAACRRKLLRSCFLFGNFFLLILTQYKIQETLNIEAYWMKYVWCEHKRKK